MHTEHLIISQLQYIHTGGGLCAKAFFTCTKTAMQKHNMSGYFQLEIL